MKFKDIREGVYGIGTGEFFFHVRYRYRRMYGMYGIVGGCVRHGVRYLCKTSVATLYMYVCICSTYAYYEYSSHINTLPFIVSFFTFFANFQPFFQTLCGLEM